MNDREFIAVFHYDNGGTNRCGAEPYRYAEEIVRCKECKHWHEFIDAKGRGRCEADAHNPFRVSISVSDADFYCSYGERREP